MAAAPYIPSKDADLFSWASNFATLIAVSPPTYGLVSADSTAIDNVVNPFLSSYTTSVNPSTRTAPSVAAKDAARAAMLVVVRPYAQNVRNNAGVTNESKGDLGLNIPTTTRSPIFCPQTQPLLQIVAATPLSHTIRYSDANSPQMRGKPFGAKAVYVVVSYATTLGVDPNLAMPATIINAALAVPSSSGLATRQPFAILHDVSQVTKLCTVWARWVGIRGDNGPWSLPIAMTVANTVAGA